MLEDPDFQKSFVSSLIARRISQGYEDMTPAQKKIATYVLKQPIKTTTLMIADLASVAEVSITTVSRFCTNMGFDGYPKFRKDLISVVNHAMIRKGLPTSNFNAVRPQMEAAAVSLNRLRHSLTEVVSGVSEIDWEKATNVLRDSKKILLIGFGEFSYLTEIFQSHFNAPTDIRILVAGFGGAHLAERHIAAYEKCDAALLIGNKQHDREIARLCKLASQNGLPTVALTHARDSRLSQSADISFYTSLSGDIENSNLLLPVFVMLDTLLRTATA